MAWRFSEADRRVEAILGLDINQMQRDVGIFDRFADVGDGTFDGLSEEDVLGVDARIGAGIGAGIGARITRRLLSDGVGCHEQEQQHDSNGHACEAPE